MKQAKLRRFKITLILIIGLVLSVLALLQLIARIEVVSNKFDSYEELAESKSMRNGWVPNWIPESARDIREVHDLDTNDSLLYFRAPREESIKAISSHCTLVEFQNMSHHRKNPAFEDVNFGWTPRWSAYVLTRIQASIDEPYLLQISQCGENLFSAIDNDINKDFVYIWRN